MATGVTSDIAEFANLRRGTGSPESAITATPGALYQDTTNGRLYEKRTGSGNTGWSLSVQDAAQLGQLQGTGILTGGIISINADTTKFDVTAGTGYVVDNFTNPAAPTVVLVTWGALTAQVDTFLATALDTQLAINSSGTLVQFNSLLTAAQRRDYIFLGKTVHTNLTVINAVVNQPTPRYNDQLTVDDLIISLGVINVSGNAITANGANLKINRSAGTTFRRGAAYATNAKVPNFVDNGSASQVSFQYRYRNGVGGFTTGLATTDLVPGSYDDGDGVLGSVGAAEWSIQRVYFFTIGTTYVVYGQAKYASLADATSAIDVEDPVIDPQFADASLRAYIIMRGNATDLTDTANNKIVRGGKFNP